MIRNALAAVVVMVAVASARAQMPFGMPVEERVVEKFDTNKDGRLDETERKAARASLVAQGPRGFFGRGAPPGFPGPGGAPMFPGRGTAGPGRAMAPSDVRTGGNAPLYDSATLRTLFIQFPAADWEQELTDFNDTDVDLPATVTVDGRAYRDVGVHFRGLSSFMMAGPGQKRSLNLSFDYANDNQRIMGVRTLNLLNSAGDPTFVRPVLYAEIASRYLPTPKANHVRVVINGESWGIYINSEQFNSDFTRDRFKSARGARWKVPGSPAGGGGLAYLGEDAASYRTLYEIRSRDDAASWTALIALTRVLNQTPADKLEAALAPVLNVDGALRFLAVEMALVNSDGYWSRGSDYSLYREESGRFHVIPHDINEGLMDESGGPGRGRGAPGTFPPGFDPAQFFGRGGFPPPEGLPGRGGPGGARGRGGFPFPGRGGVDLDPLVGLDRDDMPLRSKLLAVPALRAKYLGYVREIAEQSLDWNRLAPIAARLRALIEADVRADTKKLFTTEAFVSGLGDGEGSLRRFVEERRAFLLKATTK
jgi:hypothetical protein